MKTYSRKEGFKRELVKLLEKYNATLDSDPYRDNEVEALFWSDEGKGEEFETLNIMEVLE